MAYKTSEIYKRVIYSGGSEHRLRLWFNDVELENADDYCEKIEETPRIIPNGAKTFMLDNLVATEVTIKLHDLEDLNIIQDKVKFSIGTLVDEENDTYEYVPMGIYNLQDVPTTDGGVTTIKLRDNAVLLDKPYNAQPLIEKNGGKATLKQVLDDICTTFGLESDVTKFDGEDKEIGIYDNTINGRIYANYIAEQGGYVPIVNRYGKLQFIDLNSSDVTIIRIPLSIVEKYTLDEDFEVSRVLFEDGIIKYEKGDETKDTLYLDSNNVYINTQEQIDNIYNKFNGFKISSMTTGRVLGDPAIDPYDIIEIYDDEDENEKVIGRTLANGKFTYNGVCTDTFSTTIGKEAKQSNVTLNGENTFKKWARTEIDNVKAEVDIIAGEIKDISNSVSGLGRLTLTNCSETPLYRLSIKPNTTNASKTSLVYPRSKYDSIQGCTYDDFYPSKTLYLKTSEIFVNRGTENEKKYDLHIPQLLYLDENTYDEYIYENNKAQLIKRVNMRKASIAVPAWDDIYTTEALKEPIIIDLEAPIIDLNEGDNTIEIPSFEDSWYMDATYLLKNKYTDVFSTQAQVQSQIRVAQDEIDLSVEEKLDNYDVVNAINISTGGINIKGNRLTIDSNNFKLDNVGNVTLANGARIIGNSGLLTSLNFNSPMSLNGWEWTYDDIPLPYYINNILTYFIPDGFEVITSYLIIKHAPIYRYIFGSVSDNKYICNARNLELFRMQDNSYIELNISQVEIQDNYTNLNVLKGWQPKIASSISNAEQDTIVISNVNDILKKGTEDILAIRSLDSAPTINPNVDTQGLIEVGQKSGYISMNLIIYGYMNFSDLEGGN